MPCAVLSLDVVDVTGVHDVNIEGRLHKHQLDKDGNKVSFIDAVSEIIATLSLRFLSISTCQSISNICWYVYIDFNSETREEHGRALEYCKERNE